MKKDLIRKIKFAYQRVVRGYDDSIEWGFDDYFQSVFVPALKNFCEKELADKEKMKLNPHRKDVFESTLYLIKDLENEEYVDMFSGEGIKRLAKYFANNINIYWN